MKISKETLAELRDNLGFDFLTSYPVVLTILVTALSKLTSKAKLELGEALLEGLATNTKLALEDVGLLDGDATTTRFWRIKPAGGAHGGWECTLMIWSEETGVWLSSSSFSGRTPEAARAKATHTICGPCRTGDCFNSRHGW